MTIIYTVFRQRPAAIAAAFLLTLGMPVAQAQDAATARSSDAGPVANGPQAGDPSRWYVEDATPAAQLRTLQKEIGAALGEAKQACATRPQPERAACLKDAQATYHMKTAQTRTGTEHPHAPPRTAAAPSGQYGPHCLPQAPPRARLAARTRPQLHAGEHSLPPHTKQRRPLPVWAPLSCPAGILSARPISRHESAV
jgi:hypothetical protein